MSSEVFDKQIHTVYQNSRDKAILRCAEVMVDEGRKDLAKQIFITAHIDRNRLRDLLLKNKSQI